MEALRTAIAMLRSAREGVCSDKRNCVATGIGIVIYCVVKWGYRLCLIDFLLFGVFCDGCINLF